MITRNRYILLAGSAILATGFGLAVAAQQKPATRSAPAATAANTVAVYRSPT